MKHKLISNLTFIIIILVFSGTISGQEIRVIDNKGTIRKLMKPTIVELYTGDEAGMVIPFAGSAFDEVDIVFGNTGTIDDDDYEVNTGGTTITVTNAGTYKVTYRVTVELSSGDNRSGTQYVLQKKANTAAIFTNIEGSVSAAYHRRMGASKNTATASRILELGAGDILKVKGKKYTETSNSTAKTVPNGSSFLVERIK